MAVQARKTVDLETLPRDIIKSQEAIEQSGTSISWLIGRCTLIGLTFGSLFQFCHNEGFLPVRVMPSSVMAFPVASGVSGSLIGCSAVVQVYDVWAVKIGPLHHAGTIPFVLAPIWYVPQRAVFFRQHLLCMQALV